MKSNSFNKTKKTRRNKTTPMRRLTRKNHSRVYSKNDYRSGDGMLTATWGPPMWHYLHTMSFNYPVEPTQEDKKHYMDFVLNLQNVLPCKYCRMNLKTNLKELPLTVKCMKNRDSFSRYIYELHELVNKMLKKKSNLNISGRDVPKKTRKYLLRKKSKNLREKMGRRVAPNRFMERNQDVLLRLYQKRKRAIHFKWTRNVSRLKNWNEFISPEIRRTFG